MGLLIVSNKLERDHPEIILMALRWLEKECEAKVLKVIKGANTQYHIEGDGIPKGREQFDVIFKKIVRGVFSIRIGSTTMSSNFLTGFFLYENKTRVYLFSSN